MKNNFFVKVLMVSLFCAMFGFAANAQNVFSKGDKVVNLGIGIGSTFGVGSSALPISGSFELGVKDQLFDDKSALGIGGYVGYASEKYLDWRYTYIIVGVRGETDACFEETKQFIEKLPVSQLHVFTYSERPNTQALKIDYAVDPKTKQERSKQLLAISSQKWRDFYLSQRGKEKTVIFEHTRRGKKMFGFTENYVRVETGYDSKMVNQLVRVKLGDLKEISITQKPPQRDNLNL